MTKDQITMTDTTRRTVRVVRGLRLWCTAPGYWTSVNDPTVSFMLCGTTRLGPPGSRYTVQRWVGPGSDETAQSLYAAVKRYQRAHAAAEAD